MCAHSGFFCLRGEFVKRVWCLLCAALLFLPLFGCTAENGENQAFYDLNFQSACVTLVPLANVEQTAQNEYYFFTSFKDFEKGKTALGAYFDLDAVNSEDSSTKSFTEMTARYDESFFENNVLLFVKRYHSTKATLNITKIDAVNNVFTVHSELAEGADAASLYRAYLISFSKDYLLSEDSTVDMQTESVAADNSEVPDKVTVSMGNTYKIVEDDALGDEILAMIKGFKLTESDYNPDNHTYGVSDISVVAPGFYATFTNDYIAIGLSVYKPDSAIREKMISVYNSIPSDAQALTPETEPETEAETDSVTAAE